MGVAIPQIVTEDRAGGAQIVDGGLRFDDDKSHVLQRTSSAGSTTWTWSGWVKRSTFSTEDSLFGGYDGSTSRHPGNGENGTKLLANFATGFTALFNSFLNSFCKSASIFFILSITASRFST